MKVYVVIPINSAMLDDAEMMKALHKKLRNSLEAVAERENYKADLDTVTFEVLETDEFTSEGYGTIPRIVCLRAECYVK